MCCVLNISYSDIMIQPAQEIECFSIILSEEGYKRCLEEQLKQCEQEGQSISNYCTRASSCVHNPGFPQNIDGSNVLLCLSIQHSG